MGIIQFMEEGKQSEADLSCTEREGGREGRLPLGKRGNCPFQRHSQSHEDPAKEKGKARMQRELPWQVSELTPPWIYTGSSWESHSEFPQQG